MYEQGIIVVLTIIVFEIFIFGMAILQELRKRH